MADWKNLLSGYINKRDDGSEYLKLTNMTDEVLVIKLQPRGTKGDAYFINKTSQEVLSKNPKVPQFSKSIKVEETNSVSQEIADEIPW